MKFVYKRTFLKKFDLCPSFLQDLIIHTDTEIKSYLENKSVSYGLRIKKIGPHTFEARVTDKIRIVWVAKEDVIYFTLLGTHDEVRKFIKNL